MRNVIKPLLLALGSIAFSAHAGVCSVGDKAEVSWKGSWYKARVTKVNDDQTRCFIRYDGYGSEWDEWVGSNRIRILGGDGGSFAVGDAVKVRWKGSWYAASVMESRNGRYKIHYDGYDNSWDEWVGPDRIR
jgi:hypothetical protein